MLPTSSMSAVLSLRLLLAAIKNCAKLNCAGGAEGRAMAISVIWVKKLKGLH
jgi:hypothetical protein